MSKMPVGDGFASKQRLPALGQRRRTQMSAAPAAKDEEEWTHLDESGVVDDSPERSRSTSPVAHSNSLSPPRTGSTSPTLATLRFALRS